MTLVLENNATNMHHAFVFLHAMQRDGHHAIFTGVYLRCDPMGTSDTNHRSSTQRSVLRVVSPPTVIRATLVAWRSF